LIDGLREDGTVGTPNPGNWRSGYSYDAADNLTQVSSESRPEGNWIATPNALNQIASTGMLGTSYVYDEAGNLLGQYDNGQATGAGTQEIIWLPIENGNAIPVGATRGNRLYAIHTDHLGTPRRITDDEGTPVWQWPLSAFGDNSPTGVLKESKDKKTNQVTLQATNPAMEFNLRYPGQYFDAESRLHYNYFRSYSASQGRYTQADPIGLDGGLNRFGYVGARTFSFSDARGLNADPPDQSDLGIEPPPSSNGNYEFGFTPQDGVCTVPSWIGKQMNANKCVLSCCIQHDECYAKNGCNASSWRGNVGGYSNACQQCNSKAVSCIAKAVKSDCPSCTKK
jgi:RHS repeat-associated protein